MKDEALRLALEALEYIYTETTEDEDELIHAAVTSLRQAIEQAEKQEPVAWNSGVPPLYPEIKDGETISVKYIEATTPAAYPEFECPRCGHCCSHSSIVSGS